jgi:hypothetical protein
MEWIATTNQTRLAPGAVLSIFEDGWGAGLPTMPLPVEVNLTIRFPNGAEAQVNVIEVTALEAIIEMSNQGRWRMVPATAQQEAMAADTRGVPASYWYVKEAA